MIGVHDGIINFTIGQRKGIKVSDNEPLYVIKIDADKNEITVGCSLMGSMGAVVAVPCMLVISWALPIQLSCVHWDWGSLRTVSYTHLRAHETDSYLVCRLLLEKKK